jgi:hypothetical protein
MIGGRKRLAVLALFVRFPAYLHLMVFPFRVSDNQSPMGSLVIVIELHAHCPLREERRGPPLTVRAFARLAYGDAVLARGTTGAAVKLSVLRAAPVYWCVLVVHSPIPLCV